jgi:hypothetical protein
MEDTKGDVFMAEVGYIASALLTGVILVALVTALARARQWRSSPAGVGRDLGGGTDGGVAAMLTELARTPLAWTVGFLVLAATFGAAAVAFVSGAVPTAVAQGAGVAVAIMFVSALGAYLLWGVYHSARDRDLSDAQATLLSLWVFGFLFIAAVVLNLIMGG